MKPLLLCIYLALLPMLAQAHGPTPQKAKESVLIDAPPAKVWEVVKDFDRIAEWHPGVSASSGDGGNEAGATRKITLENGGVLEESLDYYSDADHEYNYRLKTENLEALPVSFYTASLQLSAEGEKPWSIGRADFIGAIPAIFRRKTSTTPPRSRR